MIIWELLAFSAQGGLKSYRTII